MLNLKHSFSYGMTPEELLPILMSIMKGSAHHSIIATDMKGVIIIWNEGAKNLYGYSSDEMIGKNIYELSDSKGIIAENLDPILDKVFLNREWSGQEIKKTKKGTHILVYTTITESVDKNDALKGYIFSSEQTRNSDNISHQQINKLRTLNTELKQAIFLAKDSNETVDNLIHSISHNTRTPLNAIIGFSELLESEKSGNLSPEQMSYVKEVLTSARYLFSLANQTLDINKIKAIDSGILFKETNLMKLINKTLDLFKTEMADKKIQYSICIDPTVTTIKLHRTKVSMALFNYLSNAIKFSHINGHISITVTPEPENCFRLEVTDTGIGIKEENFNQLFIPLSSLTLRNTNGNGMGLSLTKALIENQGGRVGMRSMFGKGSTFYFILPLTPHFAEKYQTIG